jgi:hypothetical protein
MNNSEGTQKGDGRRRDIARWDDDKQKWQHEGF